MHQPLCCDRFIFDNGFLYRLHWPVDLWDDRFRLVPVQISLDPHIGESDNKDQEKDCHFHKSKKPQLTIDQGPRKEHNDFHVENEKDKGDDVEADVEPHPGVADWFFAAFIGSILFGIRSVGPEDPGRNQAAGDKHGSEDEEDEDFSEFRKHLRIKIRKSEENCFKKVILI